MGATTEIKDEDGILIVQDKPYCNAWKYKWCPIQIPFKGKKSCFKCGMNYKDVG